MSKIILGLLGLLVVVSAIADGVHPDDVMINYINSV